MLSTELIQEEIMISFWEWNLQVWRFHSYVNQSIVFSCSLNMILSVSELLSNKITVNTLKAQWYLTPCNEQIKKCENSGYRNELKTQSIEILSWIDIYIEKL